MARLSLGVTNRPRRHDHVAVAVAVGGRAEIGRVGTVHQLHEVMGMDGVRIGMMAAEIGHRLAVHDRARRRAETLFEDRFGIGAGDGAQRIEAHAEAGAEQLGDLVEIDQLLHQLGVIRDGIDHLDRHVADLGFADAAEIDVRRIDDLVFGRCSLARLNTASVKDSGAGPPWDMLNLMPKSPSGPAGIVAGREDEAADGLVLADHAGGGRRGQKSLLADENAAEAVRSRHPAARSGPRHR